MTTATATRPATQFRLAACEFQMIRTPDGQIIGRLFHPEMRIPIAANSKRTVLRTEWNGKVLFFKTTLEDYLQLYKICLRSNLAANRVRTVQLLEQLKLLARRGSAPLSDLWDEPSIDDAPITIAPPMAVIKPEPELSPRKLLELQAKELGIKFNKRMKDQTLAQKIAKTTAQAA